MKLYLAGPMSGLPEFNYPAFNEAAASLRVNGHEVINPAENDGGDTSGTWAYYMRQDVQHILNVEGVAVLPGWRKSKGANLEVVLATALGLPILEWKTLLPVSETILEEAQRLVHGDRGAAYGHPADDFARTGKMWGAILGTEAIPAERVALCMIAVKVSREVNAPKRDNRVDIAGYAETLDMVHNRSH